ncbi:hypothetical protein NP493_82g05041 [Ridgeia piscesae]|uniref:Uncharacterized protein n=1 Tax=Ridgeia piscesae TaxID=27915 RepID=A0AAD9JYG2_RIDPI|nr:hypothetical protein NP493_1574g00017 [Ridgeia piscesae]KAK2190410.1 hypothetical protein NP493_82g05041 [Ridgeia piscesae]
MNSLLYLDVSWNTLSNTRDEMAVLRKYMPVLSVLDIRHNYWQKPEGLRLRIIGRLKTLTKLDGVQVGDEETAAALRMAAGSRISQVSLLMHSRTDTEPLRTLSLQTHAHTLAMYSNKKPDRAVDLDNNWYLKVTTLNLDGQHISKLSNLERLENLQWASFNNNDLTKIEGLDNCQKLEELSLESNCITRIEGLTRLEQLRHLNLSHNYIDCLEHTGFDRLPQLHYLDLEDNCITSLAGLQRALSLTELYISNNLVESVREIFYLKVCL